MKTLLGIALVCLTAQAALSQTTETPPPKHHHNKAGTNDAANAQSPGAASAAADAAAQAAQVAMFQKNFIPSDPWRTISEKVTLAKGSDWVQFEGRVQQVTHDGIVLQGWFGEPLGYMVAGVNVTGMAFILSNYPRHVVVGQLLSRNDRLVALKSGSKNDLPNLDYGTVYVPQLTDDQKAQVSQAKSATDARVLAFHQDLAAKGDAYGEYKMGLRYLNGDGVEKDPQKARELLGKSAAQGYQDAKDELAKMPPGN